MKYLFIITLSLCFSTINMSSELQSPTRAKKSLRPNQNQEAKMLNYDWQIFKLTTGLMIMSFATTYIVSTPQTKIKSQKL